MTVDPPRDLLFPVRRPPPQPTFGGSELIEPERYYELLLARRRIERLTLGVPSGFRGLQDPRTGKTWLIREETLQQVS